LSVDNFDLSTDIHNPHVREMRTVFPMKNKKTEDHLLDGLPLPYVVRRIKPTRYGLPYVT